MADITSEKPEDLAIDEKASEDPTFDSGFQAWTQVFGSFWIWFNTL